MPSKRPSPTGDSSSESDSDSPESFSLVESKKSAKRKNEEIQKAHAAIKRQSKLKNQERDRVLKEQAKRRKERENPEGEDVAVDSPEARMARAMQEAQEEENEFEDSARSGSSGLAVGGADEDEDMESGESSVDGMDDEDDEVLVKKPPKHLPDHLFEVAFASQNAQLAESSNSTIETPNKSKQATLASKKKKRTSQSKDIIVGSRTIRPLSSTSQTLREGSKSSMRKAQKYIDRSLALKGGNSRARGWQRRQANIGVMRHSGPAANFVRS